MRVHVQANINSSISVPLQSPQVLSLLPKSLLVASHLACLMNLDSKEEPTVFPGYKDPIHTIIPSSVLESDTPPSLFLAAAHSSRYINIYDIQKANIIGNLTAETDVGQLAISADFPGVDDASPQSLLVSISKDGKADIFPSPFNGWENAFAKKQDPKSRSKGSVRRPTATIRVMRPDQALSPVPILNASFQQSDLVLALAEGSTDVSFDFVRWRGEDNALLLSGSIARTKAKSGGIGANVANGVKDLGHPHVDESQATVMQGVGPRDQELVNGKNEVIEISSAEEESDDSDSSEDGIQELTQGARSPLEKPTVNGTSHHDTKMGQHSDSSKDAKQQHMTEDSAEVDEEPSFGEMLRANTKNVGDVPVTNPNAEEQSFVLAETRTGLTSNLSLGTVLSQSLRTNDQGLLETCLQVQDLQIVRATIERLGSDLAITLLQRLAERLHSRPGRVGSLLVWVQWALVAHGGYLASRPDVVRRLASLHSVVKERAKSLQPLLSLKGKLDMLEAQVNLRKSRQRWADRSAVGARMKDPVIYVEGQEESSSDSENEEEEEEESLVNGPENGLDGADEDAMDVDEEGNDEEEEEYEYSDDNSLIDDEAQESGTSHDEDLIEEIDYEDVDSYDEGPDTAMPPPKKYDNAQKGGNEPTKKRKA